MMWGPRWDERRRGSRFPLGCALVTTSASDMHLLVLSAERKRSPQARIIVCSDIESISVRWPLRVSDRKPAVGLPSTRLDDSKGVLTCVQTWLPEASPAAVDADSKCSIQQAVAARDLSQLVRLLMTGASPNTVDAYGTTPLHWAIRARDLMACKLLVQSKADIHFGSQSALEFAEEQGAMEIVSFLSRVPVDPAQTRAASDSSALLSVLSANAEFPHFLASCAKRPPQCTDMLAHLFLFAALALERHGAFEGKRATVGSVIRAAHIVFGERYNFEPIAKPAEDAKKPYVELLLKSGFGVKV